MNRGKFLSKLLIVLLLIIITTCESDPAPETAANVQAPPADTETADLHDHLLY
ncbi:hypothetical protein [Mesobacillus harenae]|uniref:hypothetical protein n=1 Tax=Mesobacillus harenae TaxID=2213203 RepID=UPI0015810BF2|nr:hypothetical protein [Mesobacillus harenae]